MSTKIAPAPRPVTKTTSAKSIATTPVAPKAVTTPSAPATPTVVKTNPSQSYIGFSITTPEPKSVNFRQGKANIITCSTVKCIGANATGRRLTVTFHDAQGNQILERRVYKEYFEKMAQQFSVELPE
jgi:hypothetical protein